MNKLPDLGDRIYRSFIYIDFESWRQGPWTEIWTLANTTIFSLLLTSTRKLLVSVLWEVLFESGMADWCLVPSKRVFGWFWYPLPINSQNQYGRIYGLADAIDTKQINELSSFSHRIGDLIIGLLSKLVLYWLYWAGFTYPEWHGKSRLLVSWVNKVYFGVLVLARIWNQ